MIRDVTGLNEARDGSTPDPNALVGIQKLAAANSNTATRHILQASLYLSLRICENISRRIGDSLNYPLTHSALENSISVFNVKTLEELQNRTIHDFGIFLELEPDEEEKGLLEQNIQMALQQNQIYLEDAIDIREIRNLKLANQVLKQRRTQKQEADQMAAQRNIEAQANANAEQAERAAMAEMQKQQTLTESTLQLEQGKSQFRMQEMQAKAEIEKQIMAEQFKYDMQLKQMDVDEVKQKEQFIEDRKDKRTQIQASQQSQMINQRQNSGLPVDFDAGDTEQQELVI